MISSIFSSSSTDTHFWRLQLRLSRPAPRQPQEDHRVSQSSQPLLRRVQRHRSFFPEFSPLLLRKFWWRHHPNSSWHDHRYKLSWCRPHRGQKPSLRLPDPRLGRTDKAGRSFFTEGIRHARLYHVTQGWPTVWGFQLSSSRDDRWWVQPVERWDFLTFCDIIISVQRYRWTKKSETSEDFLRNFWSLYR